LIEPALFDVTIDSNGAQAWFVEIRREPEWSGWRAAKRNSSTS